MKRRSKSARRRAARPPAGVEPSPVELRIENLAAGGDGVGRMPDGRAVFVPFTAPDDRVRVRVAEERARFVRGELEKVTVAGPGRCAPHCPVFGVCGGCTWQHLDYPTQVDAKREIVRDAVERIGGLTWPDEIAITRSPAAYGYRSRTRVVVEDGRVGYRRRRSHRLEPVTSCPVLEPGVDAALGALAARAAEGSAPDGEWEIAAGSDGAVRSAPLFEIGSEADAGANDATPVELELRGRRLRISPGIFAQGHGALIHSLESAVVRQATELASERGGVAVELHAGAGCLTLGLADGFARLHAVESHPGAVADLRHNLAAARIDHVEVLTERAGGFLARARSEEMRPDVVVLDPPRTGLEPGAAEDLAELGAARIVYLSCDAATLARDIGVVAGRGYELTGLEAFDLFPQTAHVEVLATLDRVA